MKPRAFLKTFMLFLLTLCIPLVVFFAATSIFTHQQLRELSISRNTRELQQIEASMEMILNQITQLSLSYDLNTDVGHQLDLGLQRSGSTYTSTQTQKTIRALSSAELLSRPYIQSIHIYFDATPQRVFSSLSGITNISALCDTGWLDSYLAADASVDLWTQARTVRRYAFEQPFPVITIFQRTYSRPGVIVLNLLPDYIEKNFLQQNSDTELYIAVTDEHGTLLLDNDSTPYLDAVQLRQLSEQPDSAFSIPSGGASYLVTKRSSSAYGWTYLAIIPETSLNRLSRPLFNMFVITLLICLLLGLFLSWRFTSRSYRQMTGIMCLLDSAAQGGELPELPASRYQDEYEILTDNLVKSFLEQRYKKLESSERTFHVKALELMALQAQINPHFMFNTLKTIYWKSYSLTDGANDVSSMIESLSGILHYSLENPGSMASVREEIQQTKNYLDIQTTRYRNRFRVELRCPEDVMELKLLRLILQPLVENSIVHGILQDDRALPERGIRITVCRSGDMLRLRVTDNGIGMCPEALADLRRALHAETTPEQEIQHIGLHNTVKRLFLQYGEQAQVRIQSRYRFGTSITISIPVVSDDQPESQRA